MATFMENVLRYQTCHSDIKDGSREQFLIGKAYSDGAKEYINKACRAFCLCTCTIEGMCVCDDELQSQCKKLKVFRKAMEVD